MSILAVIVDPNRTAYQVLLLAAVIVGFIEFLSQVTGNQFVRGLIAGTIVLIALAFLFL